MTEQKVAPLRMLRPVYDDPTPEHLLQAYFDPRKSSRGIFPGCRGQRIWQWVALDRLPDMLLLRMSMQHKGEWVDRVLRPVTLLVDAVEERDLEDGRPPVWRPGRMQVTYKPVVVGLVRQYKVWSSTGALRDSLTRLPLVVHLSEMRKVIGWFMMVCEVFSKIASLKK